MLWPFRQKQQESNDTKVIAKSMSVLTKVWLNQIKPVFTFVVLYSKVLHNI